MKINRNNYELFFIDFFDGNLTDAQKHELDLFLAENPDLKEEFDSFEIISIDSDDAAFSQKHELKKKEIVEVSGINEENYEQYFVAFYENDLNDEEKKLLLSFIDLNLQLRKEFDLHGSLIIEPNNVTFVNKDLLKKKITIAYYWYAAAAVALIFLTISIFVNQNIPVQKLNRTELAQLKSLVFSGTVSKTPSINIIQINTKRLAVRLPEPESYDLELIPLLTSVELKSIVQKPDINLIEPENYYSDLVMPNTDEIPKRRSLFAQFFRSNIEQVSEDLGINNSSKRKSNSEKKDPGFVKFLDGSLMVFNTITGSDAELVKNYDEKGNLTNYRLEGETLSVSRKLPSSSN